MYSAIHIHCTSFMLILDPPNQNIIVNVGHCDLLYHYSLSFNYRTVGKKLRLLQFGPIHKFLQVTISKHKHKNINTELATLILRNGSLSVIELQNSRYYIHK